MRRSVTVAVEEGLHARPAALFVAEAGRLPVPVTIAKDGGPPVPAASILSVMTLGVRVGDVVALETAEESAAARVALDTLESFLTTPVPG